jgi:peptidoglycan/LPS O-acetylase OafA/YrhL
MWGMPLLFVISGMGIWYSLRSRTMKAFSWERVHRLLVPLVFGVLVIVPPHLDVQFTPGGFPFLVGSDPATVLFEWGPAQQEDCRAA